QVYGDVHLFLNEQPVDGVSDLLGQSPVGFARVHPVQVADLRAVMHAAVEGDVYLGIGLRFVGRVRAAGAVAERARHAAFHLDGEIGRHVQPILVVIVDVGVVAVGDDNQPAGGRDGPLDQNRSSDDTRGLVAVGATLDVHRRAGLAGVKVVHAGVARRALEGRMIVAQPADGRDAVAGTDVMKRGHRTGA